MTGGIAGIMHGICHPHRKILIVVAFPLGVLTSVTGVSGSGKSSLVSQVLVELMAEHLGLQVNIADDIEADPLEDTQVQTLGGRITSGMKHVKRLVVVNQKPIGRTPRSNLATYTGLFDHVRKLFAVTPMAKARKFDAGRFRSMSSKGAARIVKVKAWSWSNCCSCRVYIRLARPAAEPVITPKHWRCCIRKKISRRCWA
ncbi:hypothetical protein QWY89_07995 [Mucilaginibacter myungsuensis]|nr:hypothetical protein [Mucilaginibacter myungsuensis]